MEKKHLPTICVLITTLLFFATLSTGQLPIHKLKLPTGFRVSVYARVENARQMALTPNGTLFVGSMQSGKVFAVTPDRKVHLIASRLNLPVGVAFHGGNLYVSAVDRIIRYGYVGKFINV